MSIRAFNVDYKAGVRKLRRERIRQARNLANAAYVANLRLGMTPKQARKASTMFVPKAV